MENKAALCIRKSDSNNTCEMKRQILYTTETAYTKSTKADEKKTLSEQCKDRNFRFLKWRKCRRHLNHYKHVSTVKPSEIDYKDMEQKC